MPDAVVEAIRIYGPTPAISPAAVPDVGVSVVGADDRLGVNDSVVSAGGRNIAIPPAGSNRSIIGHYAMRVIQVADPVTTISNVRFFVSQANLNALEGQYDGVALETPDSSTSVASLDAFVATGPSQGQPDPDYNQATRVLGPQGYVGDSISDVYGFTVVDMLQTLGVGQLDLTGLGRADGTVATFGQTVNDVSRMLLLQWAVSTLALRGAKDAIPITVSYDETV